MFYCKNSTFFKVKECFFGKFSIDSVGVTRL
jgi:hypothetical protein